MPAEAAATAAEPKTNTNTAPAANAAETQKPAAAAVAAATPAQAQAATPPQAAATPAEKPVSPLAQALDEKPAGEQAAAAAPAAETVPEKYEFKTPEGVNLDIPTVEKFTAIAKELKMTQAAAQKLVDFDIAREQARTAEIQAYLMNGVKTLATDPNPAERNMMAAKGFKLAVASLSKEDAESVKAMIFRPDSFLGCHPGFVRLLAAYGRLVSEDKPAELEATRQAKELTWADKAYPTLKKA